LAQFIAVIEHYLIEIIPALTIGFFLSGLIHEFVPDNFVEKHLGKKGLRPIFYATITGTFLPICCWGALPVAVSLYKKGSKMGPVLAFLIATPATSISALLVTYRLLGLKFAVFIFFAVIFMGMLMGIIGNRLTYKRRDLREDICPHCNENGMHKHNKNFAGHMKSVFKFAFWDMPKEIGLETLLGVALAAVVMTVLPVGLWIKHNLSGGFGYFFSLALGIIMYVCSTATVPLVDAFIKQGMSAGAGMVFLLAGPVTSYGTILVLRKEFGTKILLIYLSVISACSLFLGYIFGLI